VQDAAVDFLITANPMAKLRRNLLLLSTVPMAIGVIAAQSPDVTDWQTAAGGKMAFEVASVKPGKAPKIPNFPLDNRNAKTRGGRFSASFPLSGYISFAYKLSASETNLAASVQLPKWFDTDLFADAGQKPGGKAEALAPQRLADFHHNGAELMTQNNRYSPRKACAYGRCNREGDDTRLASCTDSQRDRDARYQRYDSPEAQHKQIRLQAAAKQTEIMRYRRFRVTIPRLYPLTCPTSHFSSMTRVR
jgi:hypothetical protein